jgi:hypothetical protein
MKIVGEGIRAAEGSPAFQLHDGGNPHAAGIRGLSRDRVGLSAVELGKPFSYHTLMLGANTREA